MDTKKKETCLFARGQIVTVTTYDATMDALLRSHGFIHIPKTGGTSIEQHLNATQAIIRRRHSYKTGAAPPWHLPPDVYASLYNNTYMRPTFCVVREPRERLQSCLNWGGSVNFHTPLSQLPAAFAGGRHAVRWSEEYAHRMPQSWFVWSDRGDVLCDCVVPYEKLNLKTHLNGAGSKQRPLRGVQFTFPRRLYEMDALLHHAALGAPRLCYAPKPLWENVV